MTDSLEFKFKKLSSTCYELKSPITYKYNCVAFAMQCEISNWWPLHARTYYWPVEPRVSTTAGFVQAFESCGFIECEGGNFEEGFVKIAIYVYGEDGMPSHVARQHWDSRMWASKCGDREDILHELEGLEGPKPAYGSVTKFMKCKIGNEKECRC